MFVFFSFFINTATSRSWKVQDDINPNDQIVRRIRLSSKGKARPMRIMAETTMKTAKTTSVR